MGDGFFTMEKIKMLVHCVPFLLKPHSSWSKVLTTSSKRVGNESWQWRAFLFCSQKNWSFLTSFFLFLSAFSFSCSILHTRVWESNERPIGTNCIFLIFKISNKMLNCLKDSSTFDENTKKERKTQWERGIWPFFFGHLKVCCKTVWLL